eukprot:6859573-Alexandrium_andersonii.AAC.1
MASSGAAQASELRFPETVLRPIRQALAKPAAVALCGPPGCGKLTAARQALCAPINVHLLEHELTEHNVGQRLYQ